VLPRRQIDAVQFAAEEAARLAAGISIGVDPLSRAYELLVPRFKVRSQRRFFPHLLAQ
jgi:hypothetical protein